jgi:outer membrane protein assembly factor BamB
MQATFLTYRCAQLCSRAAFWILLLLASQSARGADGLIASPESGWPQWRGPRRDGISQETGLLPAWPQDGPRLLWKQTGLGKGWSSPVLAGQRLFITGDIGDELCVFAFDPDGQLLWRSPNGNSWTGSYPGARASCCYSDGRLYHLNAHGRLACLDAADGRPLWAVDICERFEAKNITWALSECLLVDGSHVIVTPGGARALMAALDKHTGETVWTTPPLPRESTSHSSPVLFQWRSRRMIANCSSAHGFGVDASDGTLLWTVPLKNQFGVNAATPIYGSGAVFFVTPYAEEGRLYQLREDGGGFTPAQIWQSSLDTVTGSGVLVDGTFFAAGYRKNKWWMALDWRTGEVTSQLKDLTTGAAIYADGRLYCLDEKGMVGLVAPEAGGLKLVGQFQLVKDRVSDAWAHPVLLDRRLYLRYHDTLYCYDVAAVGGSNDELE